MQKFTGEKLRAPKHPIRCENLSITLDYSGQMEKEENRGNGIFFMILTMIVGASSGFIALVISGQLLFLVVLLVVLVRNNG